VEKAGFWGGPQGLRDPGGGTMSDTQTPPAPRWVKVCDAGPDTIEEYDVILTEEAPGVLQPRPQRAEGAEP